MTYIKNSTNSEQQYLTILNSLSDAMHVVDRDLRILYHNHAMVNWLTELKINSDIIGKTIFKAFPFLDYNKIYKEYDTIFQNGEVLVTVEATKPFDRVLYTETSKIPIKNEGKVSQIITILRDITKQKEAEEKLRASEDQYKNIINHLMDMIIILDLKGNFQYISPQVYDISGFKPDEIIGKSGFKFMHPDDIKKAAILLKEAIKNKNRVYIEYRAIHKNGYYINVAASGRIVNIDGEDKVFAVVRNISDQKEAEQKLKESEEKFRSITEQSLMSILVLQDGLIKYFNERVPQINGYSREEILNWGPYEFLKVVHPEDKDFVLEQAKKKQSGDPDVVLQYRYRLIRKDNEIRWVENYSKTINFEGKSADLVTSIDITDRIKVEQKLKESEEKYRLITENANDLIAVLNNKIEYEYVNEAAFRNIMGRNRDKLIGGNALRWVHPDDIEKCMYAFKEGWDKGEAMVEARFMDENDKYRWLEIKGKTIYDAKGEKKVLVVSRDISERKEYGQKLKVSEEKYRYLIENALEGVWVIDSNADTILVNPAMTKILGYTVEEMIGKSVFSFMDEDQIEITKKQIEKRKLGIADERDAEYLHKNGNKVYLRLKATPIFDKYDNYKGAYAFLEDINHRKITEQKLKESEEKYSHLFMSSPYSIIISNMNGIIVDCNFLEDKITGFSKEELIGKNMLDVPMFPKKILPLVAKDFKILLKGGIPKPSEILINKKDETLVWVQPTASIFKIGDESYIQIIMQEISERKISEEKLKESEEMFRTITEQSFMGIIILQDGVFKYFNEQAANMNGYSMEEIQNWKPYEFQKLIYPDDREFVMEQARKKESGDPDVISHYQYRVVKKNGEVIWVENFSKTINYGGKPADFVMTIDINEKIKAEQKLKESEEKYRLISENTDDMIVVFNEDGSIDYLNAETHSKVLGYSMDKFEEKSFRDSIVHEDDLDQSTKSFNSILNGKNFYSQFRLRHKNGQYLWFEVTGKTFLDNQGNKKLLCVSRNINEQKLADYKIKESEENFRTIAEQAFIGTLIIQDNKVEYVNNALLQIFDFTHEETINWTKDDLTKLIYPEDLQYLREYRQRLRDNEPDIKQYYSYRVFTKYGKIKWIDQFSKPIIYRGKPAELITIMDITEKKKAEQELMKLNNLKSELLRRTSHELKTPLVSIKGFSDLLLTVHKEKLDDYVLATIHEIKLGCERLESLIQDILKTSELESESVELKKSEEDLAFLIKLCVKELQGLIRLRNHEIQLDIHDKLMARFEPDQLHLVVSNLLNNAIKYTPPNGKININSAITDEYILISIEDNGIGITSEEKKRLFTQFGKIERYGQGLDIISEGSGLGLYITKKIIDLHGGTIRVRSKGRNKGSTFYFTLPISSQRNL